MEDQALLDLFTYPALQRHALARFANQGVKGTNSERRKLERIDGISFMRKIERAPLSRLRLSTRWHSREGVHAGLVSQN